jgi:hypothetical protein
VKLNPEKAFEDEEVIEKLRLFKNSQIVAPAGSPAEA